MKVKNVWTDKNFTELLKLLGDVLPQNNKLPTSTYEAKKILCPMVYGCEKIHERPNDCVLFQNEYKDLHTCPKCGASRYKPDVNYFSDENNKRPHAKVFGIYP